MDNLHDFYATTLTGKELALRDFRGRLALVVNTASKCTFTPQYEGLQALYKTYRDHGLEVLAFPCNQFGNQEPGSAADIARFCQRHYGVSFHLFAKVEVNGPGAHPLFKWLTAAKPGIFGTRWIKWNFTKFLISRDGVALRRYGSWTRPGAIAADIDGLLG